MHRPSGVFRRLTRPQRGVVTAAALAIAVVAAAGAEAGENKAVTLAMSLTPLSAPAIVAENQGYFEKYDLDVSIRDFIGGMRAAQAVFRGDADISTSSETVVMFNSFERSDFAVICTFVTSDDDVKIIARKTTGIAAVEDLKSRRVGTVMGASTQYFLDEALFLAGVESSRVDVVHMNPEDGSRLLAEGGVDAIVVWEPLAHLARKALGTEARVIPHERIYTESFNALVLRAFAAKNPAILDSFARALADAIEFIHADPKESQRIVAARIGSSSHFGDLG